MLGAVLAAPLVAEAQSGAKPRRIGVLSTADGPEWEAFRQGLRTLGYTEGRNIFIEYRWHAGKFDSLPALAAELVSLKVDLIVATGPQATRAAKAATATIPIVFMTVGDTRIGSAVWVMSLAEPSTSGCNKTASAMPSAGEKHASAEQLQEKVSMLEERLEKAEACTNSIPECNPE